MLVSIGIPIYNGGQYLKLAIDSVLQQSYADFELLLINDGSTDNSVEIMKSYDDPRIKLFNDGENKGLIFRLNQLVTIANGDYFARMDADDIMFPERIEKQLKLFNSDPNIDIVYGDAISIDKENAILGYKKSQEVKDRKDVLNGNFPIHPTVMIKKEVLLKNPYKEGYIQMEDMELWYRLVENYRFKHICQPLLFYREDSSNNSQKHLKMITGKVKFADTYKDAGINKIKMMFESYIKYAVYLILETVNKEHVLLNKRFQPLKKSEKNDLKKQLDSIINGTI